MKYILRLMLFCSMLFLTCIQTSRADDVSALQLVYQCDSGSVIAARVTNEFGYAQVKVHIQYPYRYLQDPTGKPIVTGIEINSRRYQLEPVYIDEWMTGSRTDYDYRISNFSERNIFSARIYISENTENGEEEYVLDFANENGRMISAPAIVKATSDGNVYAVPSSFHQPIGKLFAGTKMTVYFTTDDGWAAIGVGTREAEVWGYMKEEEIYIGEDDIYSATSRIQQLNCINNNFVYSDVGCTHLLYEIQADNCLDILGYFGEACFIKSGYRYGYISDDIVRNCSVGLSNDYPFTYQADVRRALLKIKIVQDTTNDYLVSANIEYTSQYTVNDDIEDIAVYANGNNRYVLTASNDYSVLVLLEDQLTSLVLVPIWASGGELIEDAVIVPILNLQIER